MPFTIGQVGDKAGLAAICDQCGEVRLTTRDENNTPLLPEGWQRIGQPEHVCTMFTIPIYRSTLLCSRCADQHALAAILAEAHTDDAAQPWRTTANLDDFEAHGGIERLRELVEDY